MSLTFKDFHAWAGTVVTMVDRISDGRGTHFVAIAATREAACAAVIEELVDRTVVEVHGARLATTDEIGVVMPADEVPAHAVTGEAVPWFRAMPLDPPAPDDTVLVVGIAAAWVHYATHALLDVPLTETSALVLCLNPHPEDPDP